jgi:hypothetical protein
MPTKTPVDIYVEKQALFTAAQAKWDAIQDKNAGNSKLFRNWLFAKLIPW